MRILSLAQGSPEWIEVRGRYCTASEAPAALGVSKKLRRNELLALKATGSKQEFSDWVQKNLLDRGHEIEAAARAIAEEIVGEELFPCTGVSDDDTLLASFDGLTMLGDTTWENKSWNEAKAQDVRAGLVPEEDYWQVVQQLVVSGAERCLYMVTDGTHDRTVYTWLTLDPADEKRLRDGWAQFQEDLQNFQPAEEKPKPTASAIMDLPALSIQLVGEVKGSNLAVYKDTALAFIQSINTDLKTDDDFAQAEATVKFCDRAEKELELVKAQALSQTATIDELFRTIDLLKEEMRAKRLHLDKLVKSRKETIKVEIKQKAEADFAAHVAAINERLGRVQLPPIRADFAGAMKSKRTLASLQDAVDTELARSKVEANNRAEQMAASLAAFDEAAKGHEILFRYDLQTLIEHPAEYVTLAAQKRIAEHEAAQAAKAAAPSPEPQRFASVYDAIPEAKPEPVVAANDNRNAAGETVTIPKAEYERLLKVDEWMDCLEAAGVDNWEGIEHAIDIRKQKRKNRASPANDNARVSVVK